MDFSVGDFAEKLLAQEQVKSMEQPPSAPVLNPTDSFYSSNINEQAPDISNIKVPENFVAHLLDKEELQEAISPTVEEKPPPSQPISEMAELKDLIYELKSILVELKQTLVEVTAVGGLGVGPQGRDATTSKKKKTTKDDIAKMLKKLQQRAL